MTGLTRYMSFMGMCIRQVMKRVREKHVSCLKVIWRDKKKRPNDGKNIKHVRMVYANRRKTWHIGYVFVHVFENNVKMTLKTCVMCCMAAGEIHVRLCWRKKRVVYDNHVKVNKDLSCGWAKNIWHVYDAYTKTMTKYVRRGISRHMDSMSTRGFSKVWD